MPSGIPQPLAVLEGGTGATTQSGARANLGAPASSGTNAFSGSNTFAISGGAEFKVSYGALGKLDITNTSFALQSSDESKVIDIENGVIYGQISQLQKAYAIASASTYNTWLNIETVVSTYSSTGAQAITLPLGVGTNGRVIRIVDGAGSAATHNITISRAGSDTILGSTTATISTNYGVVAYIYLISTTNWVPVL